MKLGDVVRERRKQLGKTLQDVALEIPGYDAGNLSRFERGEQDIDSKKLKPLAKSLETTIYELYKMLEAPCSPMLIEKSQGSYTNSNAGSAKYKLPLKTWETVEDDATDDMEQVEVTPNIPLSSVAFAIFYDMETPDWKDAYYLIFDPDTDPGGYEYWCAKLPTEKAASLKRGFSEAGEIYLSSANIRLKDDPSLADDHEVLYPLVGRSMPID